MTQEKHWRALTPENNDWLGHWSILNLGVEEIEVTIETAEKQMCEFFCAKKKKKVNELKFLIKFKEFDLPMMQNVINPQQIEDNLGTHNHNLWIGETITIYATVDSRNKKPCIRVKPQKPKAIDFDSVKAEFLTMGTKADLRKHYDSLPNRAKTKDIIAYITELSKELK